MDPNKEKKAKQQKQAIEIIKESDRVSAKLSDVGRQVVFAIIAAAWTLSYTDKVFNPSTQVKWSLALAFLYLFLDILYYFVSRLKYLTFVRFDKDDSMWQLSREMKKITKSDRNWKIVSVLWIIIKTPILLLSSILIIIHVLNSI